MPINPDAVGTVADPVEVSWTSKDCLLYAVGVGAGTEELAFTTENTNGVPQQVLPTFAVIVGIGGAAMASIGTFNFAMLVHGEQAIELHKPIPVEGRIKVTSSVSAIWDKGSAAVVEMAADAADATTNEPMFTTRMAAFIRGEGGWGGDRGPSGPRNVPPEREPDQVVRYQTDKDQALIYRLSGDRNPLHSDPSFAKMGGFDRPILHGLCTYGFTGRALLHALCGSDPGRFRAMQGRFSKPVYPGDELTVKMWETEPGQAVFRTETQRGETVIDSGLCRFS
jgi:acyl dehydratase